MKKYFFKKLLLVSILLCLVGCETSNKTNKLDGKINKSINEEITEYFKKNLDTNWEYSDDKYKIDKDHNVEVIYNNIENWSYCGYTTNKTIINLDKEINFIKEIPSITFICKNNDNIISRIVYKNISSITQDNINKNFKIYDKDDKIINQTIEEGFKNDCVDYKYKDIFRNSEDYLGKSAKIVGEVIQVMEDTKEGIDYWLLRVNMTKDNWGYYDDTIMIMIEKSAVKGRIIEDDIFTFYGILAEPVTYETVLGSTQTIPAMLALYGELNN